MMQEIDKVARLWEKTKDPRYKNLWYKLVKEFVNGINNTDRRNVSSSSGYERNDTRNVIGK